MISRTHGTILADLSDVLYLSFCLKEILILLGNLVVVVSGPREADGVDRNFLDGFNQLSGLEAVNLGSEPCIC